MLHGFRADGRFVGSGGTFVLWGGRDAGLGVTIAFCLIFGQLGPRTAGDGARAREGGWRGDVAREGRCAGSGSAAGCCGGMARVGCAGCCVWPCSRGGFGQRSGCRIGSHPADGAGGIGASCCRFRGPGFAGTCAAWQRGGTRRTAGFRFGRPGRSGAGGTDPARHAGVAPYRYGGACTDLGSGDECAGGGAASPGGHCRK